MEYHSFLYSNIQEIIEKINPSKFPSPYGVSFILISIKLFTYLVNHFETVSVSL